MLATDGRITATDTIEGIANLAEKSLITTDIAGNVTRHRLLDTTGAYALERLGESGEREQLARLHAEYCRDLFERAETEWQTRSTTEWLADYGWRIDNVRTALDWCFSSGGDGSIGVALTAAAIPLWMHLSLLHECRIRVEKALATLRSGARGNAQREMKMLAALAETSFYTKSAVDEIEAVWTKSLEIAQQLDDTEYQLRALWGLWARLSLETAHRFCRLAMTRPDQDQIGERMVGLSEHFWATRRRAQELRTPACQHRPISSKPPPRCAWFNLRLR